MPENRHASIGTRFLNHARQQREMIILRQKNRGFRAFHFLQHHVGKAAIDALILQPIIGTEHRARVCDVAKRPQPFV